MTPRGMSYVEMQNSVCCEDCSVFYALTLGHVTDDFLRNVAFHNPEPLCCGHYGGIST